MQLTPQSQQLRGTKMDSIFIGFPWQDFISFLEKNAFFFTVVGGLLAASTWLFNRAIGRRQMTKLRQDEQTQSDIHILNLCKALSDSKQSLQLAGAALLVDRARTIEVRGRPGSERSAILQALLAATINDKRSNEQLPASSELCKFIGDSIVDIVGARDSVQQKNLR